MKDAMVSSWTPLSPLMRTSRFFARHVTSILDLFDTLGIHSQLTWLSRSLSQYCYNSLLSGISAFNMSKLQRVQNLAAKIALNDWYSPAQELLSQLHWLPKIQYTLALNQKSPHSPSNFWPRINLQTFDHL